MTEHDGIVREGRTAVAVALLLMAQPSPAQQSIQINANQSLGSVGLNRDEIGRRATFVCPAGDGKSMLTVYGTDVYTDSSPICPAAIHAGALKAGQIGVVTLVIGSGAESFQGSQQNGVTSASYGRHGFSYSFPRDGEPGTITWRTTWNWNERPTADLGAPITLRCPAGGKPDALIYGTAVYAVGSAICVAAVHTGVIRADQGGLVAVTRAPALRDDPGSERSGIVSRRLSATKDSFTVAAVVGAGPGSAPPTTVPPTVVLPQPTAQAGTQTLPALTPNQTVTRGPGASVPSVFAPPVAAVPTGFAARVLGAGGTGGAVSLSWQAVSGAEKYRLEGPGIVPAGLVVPSGTYTVSLRDVPPGAQSWRMAAVYANDFWDSNKMATATAMVRFMPSRQAPWLSKYGAGSSAGALQHYRTLCPGCWLGADWDTFFLPSIGGLGGRVGVSCSGGYSECPEAQYTNVTDFGTQRKTACFGLNAGGTLCYSKSGGSHGMTVIVNRQNSWWFLAFTSPDDDGPYTLTDRVTLDSENPKLLPNTCLACHGGDYDPANGAVQSSTLLPLDPTLLQVSEVTTFENGLFYPNLHSKEWVDETLIRPLNQMIAATSSSPAVGRYVNWIYGNQMQGLADPNFLPQGWVSQAGLYRQVIKPYCVMCHLASTSTVDFSSAQALLQQNQRIFSAVCTTRSMPHAEIAFTDFWTKDTGQIFVPGVLAATLGYQSCP